MIYFPASWNRRYWAQCDPLAKTRLLLCKVIATLLSLGRSEERKLAQLRVGFPRWAHSDSHVRWPSLHGPPITSHPVCSLWFPVGLKCRWQRLKNQHNIRNLWGRGWEAPRGFKGQGMAWGQEPGDTHVDWQLWSPLCLNCCWQFTNTWAWRHY